MKNLRKIIALFLFIFLAGVLITVRSINTTLNKQPAQETVESKKDTLYLIEAEKKTV
ncbi:hypothetical protein OD91_1661 [Lutibacter sp. Hel_I_33_5]|uniref:hypothetical protein n=1 Tax=Lutibacter sp. Hel_I_33_5 TaxID=1566289 RepID=UPI0011AC336B|nr:hypothetical protein [Lutibacter sp. Hel_I_33_5]TVZ56376.1 hypothetical protein OD91_1661 [Lutibacter sp. Hel_I_33_5]